MARASVEAIPITEYEAEQVERANATTATPVVFVPASGSSRPAGMRGRGRSPTIDDGWREVAETALTFVRRFA